MRRDLVENERTRADTERNSATHFARGVREVGGRERERDGERTVHARRIMA